MNRKKILVWALVIFSTFGGIGLGIHLLHKKAYATNYYKIIVCDAGENGIANHPVSLKVGNELRQDGETDANGVFDCEREGDPTYWKAWVYDTEDWEFEAGFPIDNPIASLDDPGIQTFFMRDPED